LARKQASRVPELVQIMSNSVGSTPVMALSILMRYQSALRQVEHLPSLEELRLVVPA
jgi:hypothetical protein